MNLGVDYCMSDEDSGIYQGASEKGYQATVAECRGKFSSDGVIEDDT